ncbi:hypothetical protein [Microtetraspora malaysiensis]|uniref:hypothetical protein n=1 Tax=Microtetraspora malaysiensis TaxID=161358 RepID=UPI003D904FF2
MYSVEIGITRSERGYHSYSSLKADAGVEQIRELTREDADHYAEFCREQAALGVPAIFRTAINAQSLYLVRRRLQAVKVDAITASNASLLLVRDEAQGFYTGENTHIPGALIRTMAFSGRSPRRSSPSRYGARDSSGRTAKSTRSSWSTEVRASAPGFRPGAKARAGVPARARACLHPQVTVGVAAARCTA